MLVRGDRGNTLAPPCMFFGSDGSRLRGIWQSLTETRHLKGIPTVQLKARFEDGSDVPVRFTCDGANVSPDLHWTAPPAGTESLVLIVDDPDAPGQTWVHWLLYDLPATERELPEGVTPKGTLPSGAHQGRNDFGKIGYGGPCPPPGPAHRYYFALYALDKRLELRPGATRAQIERSMAGHILARAELMGQYIRQPVGVA
jgi:Raf kinase inhibitor-like YbhB/YbcL family protein